MTQGLTDRQQGAITSIAEFLQLLSVMSIPSTMQGQLPPWFPFVLYACGAASKALMQFKGATPQQQQTVLDTFKQIEPWLQKLQAMPPQEQQSTIAATLAALTMMSTLSTPQPTKV